MKDNIKKAEWLVAEAHKNGGLAPVDVEKFWKDQDEAIKDPFSIEIKQLPLNVFNSTEVVFDELGISDLPTTSAVCSILKCMSFSDFRY